MKGPPRIVILSKHTPIENGVHLEQIDTTSPDGFDTWLLWASFALRNNNGMTETVTIVDSAFSNSNTIPSEGNKYDRTNKMFAVIKAKILPLNGTIVFGGNLDYGDDDTTLMQNLHKLLEKNNFVDSWTQLKGKNAGYTLDYTNNANTLSRKDVDRKGKYPHGSLRVDRLLLHSKAVHTLSIELIGNTQSKRDALDRNTGIYPSDHYGLYAKYGSGALEEATGGIPVIAIVFLSIAACLCLSGIAYFLYSKASGGGGTEEEQQKLTGDDA